MLALSYKTIPLARKSREESMQYKVIHREKGHSQTGSMRILRKLMGNSKVNGGTVRPCVNGMREDEGIFWCKRLNFSGWSKATERLRQFKYTPFWLNWKGGKYERNGNGMSSRNSNVRWKETILWWSCCQ